MGQARSKPAEQVFPVSSELEKKTLSAALRGWMPGESWSHVRKLIEGRRVMVSGNLCVDAGRRLQANDVVKVLAQAAAAAPKEDDVRLQFLDAHVVVAEKPAGMTSNRHREESRWPTRRKQIQPTLDELLPHIITKIEGRRNRRGVPLPVRAVHRIDRDTSGLIVFARTHAAESILAQQFRQHATHRRYLAIVEGKVKAQTISSHLVRDRGDGRRGSTDNPEVGKAGGDACEAVGDGWRLHAGAVPVGDGADASDSDSFVGAWESGVRRKSLSAAARREDDG